MKIQVGTDGKTVYLIDEHGEMLECSSGQMVRRDQFDDAVDWMKTIIAQLDVPIQVKEEATAHADELLQEWDNIVERLKSDLILKCSGKGRAFLARPILSNLERDIDWEIKRS